MVAVNAIMQVRRDTAANLASENAVYAAGEIVFETDTRRIKVGDGSTVYSGLGFSTVQVAGTFTNYSDLLSDTGLTYEPGGAGSVAAGDLIYAGAGYWEVAASDASDHHVTTAGGVKLYEAGPNFSTRARLVAAHDRNVAAGRTVPAGTVWTFPGGEIVSTPGATSVPGLAGWAPFGMQAKFALFGAVGDTVIAADGTLSSGTDDTTAMQAACDWANAARGRKVLGDDGATYRVTAEITGTGDLRVDLGSARIFATANANIFTWVSTLYGPFDLATSYTAGDLSIDLTGDPLPAAPLKGTVMKIVSDGVDPGNRDEGSNASQSRIGEWFVVGSGSTTTNIVLHRPLRFTRAISPTSTAGDEGEVDSYTTTLSARVVYANHDEVFEFTGGVIGYEYGHDASWTADAIHLTGYHSPRVLTHVQKCYSSGVRTYGTVDAEMSGCSFADFRPDRGYGVSDAGWNTVAKDLRGSNIRHVYSSSIFAMTAGRTEPEVLIGAGRTVGATFGGHAQAGEFAHWDTHHDADGVSMVDAFSEGGGLYSHAARGRGIDIVRPKSRNMAKGVYVFTEYDSGDPDEDYFTAGKTLADFTSARVVDPDIECVEEPLHFANVTAKMSGNGKFVAADHCMIYNNGGEVIIDGRHEFTARRGKEVVPHADGATDWTAFSNRSGASTVVNGSGQLEVSTTAPDTFAWAGYSFTAESGKTYQVRINKVSDGSTTATCGIASSASGVRDILELTGTGDLLGTFVGTGATVWVALVVAGSGNTATYGSVSITEAPSHTRTGCIDLDEANANNGGALATTLIIEGTVLIDARDASAGTVYGLNLGANCQVIVRGRLKLNLPTGSTLQTGSGTLTVEGKGIVEHYNGSTLQDVLRGDVLSSDLTVNIPTDYATWQDAIDALSYLKVRNGATITVNLESGETIASGLLLENGDYRHFILTADDATTYLDAGFVGVTISGAPTQSSNAVIALYRAHGPTLSCLIDMNGANGAGLFITTNSMMEVSPSCGIINALRYGVSVSSTSTLNADNSNFSGSGWGNRVTTSSNASLRKANLSGGVDQDAEAACLVISRGSFVDLRGDPLDMTDLSGATYNGIYCRRSFLSADWVDVSGAGAYGLRASHGSHVSFYGGNADGCSIGIGSLESWVNAKNATAIGCTDRAVYAEDGGFVNAYGVDGSGCTGTYGARASDGSEINIVDGNMTKAVSDTNDISVRYASTIRAAGSSGQLSQTANVIGTNGVIIK